jgi:hypothetical protein
MTSSNGLTNSGCEGQVENCCQNQQIDLHKLMTTSNGLTNSGCEGQFADLDNSIQKTGGSCSLDRHS